MSQMKLPEDHYNPSLFANNVDHLLCPICHWVLRDAVSCPSGHSFCRACIDQWLRSHSTCPLDRGFMTRVNLVPNLIANQVIRSQVVYCPYSSQGSRQRSPKRMKKTYFSASSHRNSLRNVHSLSSHESQTLTTPDQSQQEHPGDNPIEVEQKHIESLSDHENESKDNSNSFVVYSSPPCLLHSLNTSQSTSKPLSLSTSVQVPAMCSSTSSRSDKESVGFKRELIQGCDWKGPLDKHESHINVCLFAPVSCKFHIRGCTTIKSRHLISHHEEICSYRIVICPHCNQELNHSHFNIHVEEFCPEVISFCHACNKDFVRKSLDEHVKQCPFVVVNCRFPGCVYQCQRSKISEHESDPAYTSSHISGLLEENRLLRRKYLDLRERTIQSNTVQNRRIPSISRQNGPLFDNRPQEARHGNIDLLNSMRRPQSQNPLLGIRSIFRNNDARSENSSTALVEISPEIYDFTFLNRNRRTALSLTDSHLPLTFSHHPSQESKDEEWYAARASPHDQEYVSSDLVPTNSFSPLIVQTHEAHNDSASILNDRDNTPEPNTTEIQLDTTNEDHRYTLTNHESRFYQRSGNFETDVGVSPLTISQERRRMESDSVHGPVRDSVQESRVESVPLQQERRERGVNDQNTLRQLSVDQTFANQNPQANRRSSLTNHFRNTHSLSPIEVIDDRMLQSTVWDRFLTRTRNMDFDSLPTSVQTPPSPSPSPLPFTSPRILRSTTSEQSRLPPRSNILSSASPSRSLRRRLHVLLDSAAIIDQLNSSNSNSVALSNSLNQDQEANLHPTIPTPRSTTAIRQLIESIRYHSFSADESDWRNQNNANLGEHQQTQTSGNSDQVQTLNESVSQLSRQENDATYQQSRNSVELSDFEYYNTRERSSFHADEENGKLEHNQEQKTAIGSEEIRNEAEDREEVPRIQENIYSNIEVQDIDQSAENRYPRSSTSSISNSISIPIRTHNSSSQIHAQTQTETPASENADGSQDHSDLRTVNGAFVSMVDIVSPPNSNSNSISTEEELTERLASASSRNSRLESMSPMRERRNSLFQANDSSRTHLNMNNTFHPTPETRMGSLDVYIADLDSRESPTLINHNSDRSTTPHLPQRVARDEYSCSQERGTSLRSLQSTQMYAESTNSGSFVNSTRYVTPNSPLSTHSVIPDTNLDALRTISRSRDEGSDRNSNSFPTSTQHIEQRTHRNIASNVEQSQTDRITSRRRGSHLFSNL